MEFWKILINVYNECIKYYKLNNIEKLPILNIYIGISGDYLQHKFYKYNPYIHD